MYLVTFVTMFTNADDSLPECQTVVSDAALLALGAAGSAGTLGEMFEGITGMHQDPGGRDEAFGEGFEAGSAVGTAKPRNSAISAIWHAPCNAPRIGGCPAGRDKGEMK